MDFPEQASAVPSFINTYMRQACSLSLRNLSALGVPAATSWIAANEAVYIPLWLPWRYTVKRVFWVNGSVASLNVDLGIYTPGGARLYSTGSTAQSGTSAPQFVTPASPIVLCPGWHYLGFAMSNTTASCAFGTALATQNARAGGLLQQATALPLPNPSTPAVSSFNNTYPLIGITNTASGF